MQACLKCGHTRTVMDDATPEGVCAKCGVAYVKLRPGVSRTFSNLGKAPQPIRGTDPLQRGTGAAFIYIVSAVMAFFLVLGTVRLMFVFSEH